MESLTIDIHEPCNYKCTFCYQEKDGFLSTKDVFEILCENPAKNVAMGGGEPFLHPELVDIVSLILPQVQTLSIATNGSIMNKEFIEIDHKDKITMQYNIPSINEEVYKELTGGNFSKVVKNLNTYKQSFFSTLYFTAVKNNIGQFDEVMAFALENDMPVIVTPYYGERELKISKNQLIELRDKIQNYRLGGHNIESVLLSKMGCSALKQNYDWEIGICPFSEDNKAYFGPDKIQRLFICV